MADVSTRSSDGSTRITPEMLQKTLRVHNLTREEFIHTFNIQPLVYVPELPYCAKATFVALYVVIFVLALAGNSLVIYIILKKRAIQTATDIFICSLAVSDLLITFFCVPFTLLQNISSEWFGGKNRAKVGESGWALASKHQTMTNNKKSGQKLR
uniref:G-protein coupled receptors family 1 profile domain-containing protein n=1 Tax=Periophthalmus magnuspinnatus TaxID=409849 RepID=A0A3B4AV54_9GOBI